MRASTRAHRETAKSGADSDLSEWEMLGSTEVAEAVSAQVAPMLSIGEVIMRSRDDTGVHASAHSSMSACLHGTCMRCQRVLEMHG